MTPVIELIGLPGAGKTSICEAAIDLLAARGRALMTLGMPRTRGSLAPIMARHSRAAMLATLSAGLSSRAIGQIPPLLRRFDFILSRAAGKAAGLQLYDEGIAQSVWSLAVTVGSRPAALWRALIEAGQSSASHALVWVEVTPALAAERLLARGAHQGRFDRLSPAETSRALDRAALTMAGIVDALPRRALRLDAEAKVADNALQMADFLQSVGPTGLIEYSVQTRRD